jgi:DNA repair protein RecO (recombination protein O)
MRITLQPAFVLHSRPYRETSVLLDLFTAEYGRVAAIAKGVRQKRSRLKPLLQPFIPLLVSWYGKGELVTLQAAEPNGYQARLVGECLFSGLYLNELLTKVLPKFDAQAQLYTIYQKTLIELQGERLQQKVLRLFEKKLLEELGYGLQLSHDVSTRSDFAADKYYSYHPEHGFELCEDALPIQALRFLGKSLIALANEQLEDDECLRDAKRLMRLAMTSLLGQYQLNSRKLYVQADVHPIAIPDEMETE